MPINWTQIYSSGLTSKRHAISNGQDVSNYLDVACPYILRQYYLNSGGMSIYTMPPVSYISSACPFPNTS
jgi:hypothetical protein